MVHRLRIPLACATALGLVLGLAPGAAAAQAPEAATSSILPTTLNLPNGFQPEGIAIGALPFPFFGSRATGDLFRVNLITGDGQIFSKGPGTPSLGMKVDLRARLFVAGGTGGDGRVVNAINGDVIASFAFATKLTDSFAKYRWCPNIIGPQSGGAVHHQQVPAGCFA